MPGVLTTSFWPVTDLMRESGNPVWSPETWAQREETFFSGEIQKMKYLVLKKD